MAKKDLSNAKQAKENEFYTLWYDIEKEVNAYLEFDPNVFRGKTILLPCDDPEWSNFTKLFALNFELYGIKKLISTSYAPDSKKFKAGYQPSLFETEDPQFDPKKTQTKGKIFILERDKTGDGHINIDDLEWHYLEGDGDFRSDEIKRLRDEADIIVTNPPFSLFREFAAWIMEAQKQFLIIGNVNAISYKEIFPLIKENKMWLGVTNFNKGMYFYVPNGFQYAGNYNSKKEMEGKAVNRVSSICWFTNIDHGRRHRPLSLMTMADNIKFSHSSKVKGKDYYHYINYDAIDVPEVDAIPSDYDGAMGVPITFPDKYCPEQFEIIGLGNGGELGIECGISSNLSDEQCKALFKEDKSFRRGKLCYRNEEGKLVGLYARILIRKRRNEEG